MRNRTSTYKFETANNLQFNLSNIDMNIRKESNIKDQLIEIFADEGRESLFNYLEGLGLTRDPNIIILSSMHHFFYDSEEIKSIKTLVNLKELNKIREIKSFVHSIYKNLPPKSYFIGCYIDNQKENTYSFHKGSSADLSIQNTEALENGIISKLPFLNTIYNIIDLRTNNFMSRRNVNLLFEDRGFKVLDHTEHNNLTYFCAQRIQTAGN